MKWRLAVCLITWTLASRSQSASCPVTVGTLTLAATTPRATGISPLLVFFDATGTTDSATLGGANNVFQDVNFSWNFGDGGTSGASTWTYGSNPGVNSRNAATGAVAAHLYITSGTDTPYTATVTANDGTNTASCTVAVTAYDPSGPNGFPGTATTCVASTTTPIAGVGGCPTGAAVAMQANFTSAVSAFAGNGHRLLFHCGDRFTGDNATLSGVKISVGAYGGCENTITNRPILSDTTNGNQIIGFGSASGDIRISDLNLEGNGSGARGVWDTVFNVGGQIKIVYQVTLSNLYANGLGQNYGFAQGAQWGVINSVATGAANISMFFNFNENNYPYSGNTINNLFYSASIGNSITGTGTGGTSGIETFRISACNDCVFTNSTYLNANSVGAVLKLHNGNTNNSSPTWTGVYTQYVELSDNYLGGSSGAQLVENAPQNGADDERLRNIVFERNLLAGVTSQGGRQLLVSAVNETVRDNAFNLNGTSSLYPAAGVIADARGVEPTPTGIEIYNNTCYQPTNVGSTQNCILMAANSCCTGSPAQNSFVKNNLSYSVNGEATYVNTGSGNAVSNNTVTTTANPSFTNGSGNFSLISDFKPTANYSGALNGIPNYTDGVLAPWPPNWNLGAIKASGAPTPPGPRHRLLFSQLDLP